MSIPRTIHYCWFGGRPLPTSALRCIASWKRNFPGYEIRRWDESNFDIDAIVYTREAASAGKWAFVSDYARFLILYRHGGIYFDTDVEVIRPMDHILAAGAFMGFEKSHSGIGVASGLGIAAPAGHPFYKKILDHYSSIPYLGADGKPLPGTVVAHVTHLFLEAGLVPEDRLQCVEGITVYPNEYFNPLDDATGRMRITPRTCSIHHYDKTWCDNYGPMRTRFMRLLHRTFGVTTFSRLRRFLTRN